MIVVTKIIYNDVSNVLTTNNIEYYDLKALNATYSLILLYMSLVCHLDVIRMCLYVTRM